MTPTVRFQYGYDQDSNVLFKNDLVTPSNSDLYAYDNMNRLTSFEVGTLSADHTSIPSPIYTWSVSLDSIGNRNTVTTNGTPTNSTFDAQNAQATFGSSNLAY